MLTSETKINKKEMGKIWWCFKLVEEMFFNKGANDFLMDFYRERQTVLRADRLMHVLSVRLLRSIHWV